MNGYQRQDKAAKAKGGEGSVETQACSVTAGEAK